MAIGANRRYLPISNQRCRGIDGRDSEEDDRDQSHGRGGPDGDDVDRQGQGRICDSHKHSDCPGQEQKANRRNFGNNKSDHFASMAAVNFRFRILG
jgi:hypothetical protein